MAKKNSWMSFWYNQDNEKKFLIIIICVSVIVRLAAAVYFGDTVTDMPGTYDQISYHNLAVRVLQGHGFTFGSNWWPATAANEPTAHWSYLYTLFLAFLYRVFGIHPLAARIIQVLIVGILQPMLIFLIGKRVFGQVPGLIASSLTAIYAYFVYYAATLMTEPFYIVAILSCIYFSILLYEELLPDNLGKPHSKIWFYTFGIGVSLGIAILLRQLLIILVIFLFLWLLWSLKQKARSKILVIAAILALFILPFTIFNYTRFNRFVLLNTNAGFAFFWGNHPIYGTHFVPILTKEMGTYQELIPPQLLSLDEAALDQALLKQGLQFVVDDPVRYFYLSVSRIPVYFMFWPSPNSDPVSNVARVASFGIMWPFMVAGLILVLFDWKSYLSLNHHKEIILMIGFMVLYTGIHLLSWTLIRYRLPVDAVALLFAGLAIERILVRTGIIDRYSLIKDEDLLRYTLRS